MSTLRGSYGRSKGRCWSGCSHSGLEHFSCQFPHKVAWNVEVHFDCAGSHNVWVLLLGRGIFPANFRIKWLLRNVDMHFDCAGSHKVWPTGLVCDILLVNFRIKWFRLCRLTQSVVRGFGLRHLNVNFCEKWLLWLVDMHFDCAVACDILAVNFCIKLLLWNVEVHFDCAGSHKVCVCVLGSFWSAAFYL